MEKSNAYTFGLCPRDGQCILVAASQFIRKLTDSCVALRTNEGK
jgi:hypothetical protein